MKSSNPLKMKYSGGYAPKGLEALNKGKTKSEMIVSKNKAVKSGGEMWKAPNAKPRLQKKDDDKSSGQSMPIKSGDDNKKRYNGIEQPTQYSNAVGPKKTKFVC